MKFFWYSFLVLTIFAQCKSQEKNSAESKNAASNASKFPKLNSTETQKEANKIYNIYVFFGSIGTGTVSNKPLLQLMDKFEVEQKVSFVKVEKISPLGREGEYALGFILEDWKETQIKQFSDELRKIDFTQGKDKNQVSYVTITDNQSFAEINKPSIATVSTFER